MVTLLGLISDVHGDFAALQDALRELERLGVDEVLCAGDLLDWGPSPGRCIELLRTRGIPCVRGNHDFIDAGGELVDVPRFLDAAAVAFIDSLPRTIERTIAGVRLVVTHGRTGGTLAPPRDQVRDAHVRRIADNHGDGLTAHVRPNRPAWRQGGGREFGIGQADHAWAGVMPGKVFVGEVTSNWALWPGG